MTRSLAWMCVVAGCGLNMMSCGETTTPTQVMIVVTAGDGLASQTETVRVLVENAEGETDPLLVAVEEGRDIRPSPDPQCEQLAGPVCVPVIPGEQNDESRYNVTIELLDLNNEPIASQSIDGGYVLGESREVWVRFDSVCELVECADGFRCQDGACVEHCVDPVRKGEIGPSLRSGPVACVSPCERNACENGELVDCAPEGYRILKQDCGFGCADEDTCAPVIASNVNWPIPSMLEVVDPETGIPLDPPVLVQPLDYVVGENAELPHLVLGTAAGSATLRREPDDPRNAVPVCGILEEGPAPCDGSNGILFQEVITTELGCDGEPLVYGVYSFGDLHVLEGASITAGGGQSRPVILLANGDVTIDGTIDVSAAEQHGPGGCPPSSDQTGQSGGLGGGGTGQSLKQGGGGASYGGRGGEGGNGENAENTPGGGGLAGAAYGNEALVPLLGGSGGGRGGPGAGAIQISANGHIRFGPRGIIVAAGGGGNDGTPQNPLNSDRSAGGGGSGGAILLEAGSIMCTPTEDDIPRISAPGGGGGGRDEVGAPGSPETAAAGAPGGANNDPDGGRGSDDTGDALPGGSETTILIIGGGGGGGAGRTRINTSEAMNALPAACGAALTPTTFGTASVQ